MEFSDASVSLSNRYGRAITDHGGLPWVMTGALDRTVIAEYVRRSDGVMLTGGDDVEPRLYSTKALPKKVARKVSAPERDRDFWELILIDEVFRQRKPLLAICRGHQILNVALGGTLIADIASQVDGALQHAQMGRKMVPVHAIRIGPDGLLSSVFGANTIRVNSTHHQAVGHVSPLLRVTAASADGIIEAMELKSPGVLPYLISVQFHPERLYDRYRGFGGVFASFIEASRMAAKGGNDSKNIDHR
ncbi:MAG TPA: gamma-glutamyl-gamma-aminobutyrate hydrolase family protein [Roseimicrobium sp.]|nr:gamma-glutamyl-gamma-aminobutyrate hydrolase family protein [Roseimicrobium sp.]